ncbi:MAG: translation elongation factor Ts [Candidatus Schekmanbacteria bacterium RIFCSPHIGHO2_02_FULL_38_11]|uniref:Elongation factor Ts n=1 Tax=Candidatus Schekmanbacteria bacterium RIFCSPLOWO2_12_FULL_38_15 TaxID=1817883 RepID=A0A1F7SH62_9BACT|nr:MAG: translation elongation factor Ts [Candidatus Schekmanbacteria bacterium GWA2_38_9]OGL48594.1 MAG: translation elongation factor Ts [Candidatus Schekmanbacteria bacterium RIFCSPLOWO2_02_FULL_38_14]OGL50140.1 MAG: translation elongation factor Ts [Candidatus Schekmanbacteria bacterium RIFCSPHIGHO2_02_FULL_38_11]OGL52574.1 MAG: translation elongation factor Ts [Candidatus Schekmanbacteria bacterium RIFCSPLOWO2_12_FULL_38_15]
MQVSATLVKDLREKTGAGIVECKQALEESKGNLDEAINLLRKKGLASAAKKATRVAKEGIIGSYIHAGGKIGVLVEVNCETDFVAKTEDFKFLVKDIAMQIAAANPRYVSREEVSGQETENEKKIYEAQIKDQKKPQNVIEKIVLGKLDKYYETVCLKEQIFIKNPELTIEQLIKSKIAQLGENISIKRFVRFHLGEDHQG